MLQWARADACPWDEWTCANAARGGHLAVLTMGASPMAALGMYGHVQVLQKEATLKSCNGLAPMAASGMNGRAHGRPEEATSQSCNGRMPTAALGMKRPGEWPKEVSGRGYASMVAQGLIEPIHHPEEMKRSG